MRTNVEPHFGDAVPSSAIRNHHQQMLDHAKHALANQVMEQRDFRGSTFMMPRSKMSQARTLIKEFHQRLRALESAEGDTEVYRFSTQLFALTQRPNR